jgi:hypothetical protein
VKTAALVGAAVVVLLLDMVASVGVGRSEVLSRAQKAAWLLAIWLAPIIGAIFSLYVSRERSVPAPVQGTLGETANPALNTTRLDSCEVWCHTGSSFVYRDS